MVTATSGGRVGATWGLERWIAYVFDRPVAAPEWYWDADLSVGPDPVSELDCLARLCEAPAAPLAALSNAQLNQGFWYLLGSGASALALAAYEGTIPVARWSRCIRAFDPLFADLFAPRCSPHLGHRDEPGADPLNGACYMWWDLLPLPVTPEGPARDALHDACLDALAAILALPSDACRESSLHGLGHWSAQAPQRVGAIIDRFLSASPDLRPELRAYALAARCGCVL